MDQEPERREDNLVVETPEQVGIDFEIAGAGSRFMAAMIDGAWMALLLLAAVILPLLLMPEGGRSVERLANNMAEHQRLLDGVRAAVVIVVSLSVFGVLWGYYIIAELVTDGRSPGKRALGLRVVREDGLPIGLSQSIVRNLVRAVDFLPGLYGVGLVTVLLSPRAQRLGDLAAGTLVVKDRAGQKLGAVPVERAPGGAASALAARPALLGSAEREVIERFLERRHDLDRDARARLATRLAAPLRARLDGAGVPDDEAFLELLLRTGGGGAR